MTSTEDKSEDKKEIEDEEREKMLNAENARDSQPPTADGEVQQAATSEPDGEKKGEDKKEEKKEEKRQGEVEKMKKALEESEKDPSKARKIPIGGIRIPGFLRSRSREKNNKDGESEQEEENKDLLPDQGQTQPGGQDKDSMHDGQTPPTKRLPSLRLIPNPFKKNKAQAQAQGQEPGGGAVGDGAAEGGGEAAADSAAAAPKSGAKRGLLGAIQLPGPLASFLPRRSRSEKDAEIGQAGLASMETLDDKSAADTAEDGMESVKLDVEDKTDGEKMQEGSSGKADWEEVLRIVKKFKYIIGVVLLFLVLLIVIIAVAVAGPSPSLSSAPLVTGRFPRAVTSCGLVEGVREHGGYAFRGIPYAQPPVGDLRWLPARLAESLDACWNGTLLAHNATPGCWQVHANGTADGEEDCLTLDIYTPRVGYHGPLPVVVLVGAETLLGGSPGDLRPSPKLARDRDVVFVRPNFRLGVLGFLAHDALSKSTYPFTSGNYALSDLLAALVWVKRNIMHFGGDAEQVTVLGHRAGATLVTALASSRKAQGLFRSVWLSSGAASFPGKPLTEASKLNTRFVQGLTECADTISDDKQLAVCMRSLDAATLHATLPDTWRPRPADLPLPDEAQPHEWLVLDGDILQRHPFEVFDNGSLPFKVIIGTTQHAEASPTLKQRYDDWVASGEVEERVRGHVMRSALAANRTLADQALHLYGTSWPGFASMVSDIRTVCPLLVMASKMQASEPVFYVATQGRGTDPAVADAAVDVEAFMGRYRPASPSQRRFMTAMQNLFYQFLWSGSIKRKDAPNTVLLIGQDTNPSLQYPNCDLWMAYDVVPRYARVD